MSAIAASSVGGFMWSAQPAMAQMLERDLHMNCWSVMVCVLTGAVCLHLLFKTIVVVGVDVAVENGGRRKKHQQRRLEPV